MTARYAVIGDIHSNLQALEAVLGRLEVEAPDAVFCLGDVVGYGAQPNECIEGVRRVAGGRTIVGNHDIATFSSDPAYGEWFNPVAKAAVAYQRRVLTAENLAWLESLPVTMRDGDCLFYHGSPVDPDHYLHSAEDIRMALAVLGPDAEYRIIFSGHTHVPTAVEVAPDGSLTLDVPRDKSDLEDVIVRLDDDLRYLVNPGSVGQPRDRVPDAAYLLVDLDEGVLRYRRVPYDVGEARRRIVESGLPAFLAARLERGV